jgi:tRNA-splicing ligase RtcB (3'-phosphate/5'-hydroxy nucleic acid ligase)
MIELKGKYNYAKIFADNIDEKAKEQIIELCNQEFVQEGKIRIMPDVHAGAGCVIGFTANIGEKVIPNIVGVDIGCGMLTIELGKTDIDLAKLDEVIRAYVPSGKNVHEGRIYKYSRLQELHCYRELKKAKWIERSIGTLGGGNHFIEVNVDKEDNKYLVIHSGSRNLGKQVAEYYQDLAVDICSGKEKYYEEREELIKSYKEAGRRNEIQNELKKLNEKYNNLSPKFPRDLCYLTGKYRERYLHDMDICQEYAKINREVMANIILDHLFNNKITNYSYFHTIHNYINFKDNIIRKGSISSYNGEKVLIPINMKDGSILGVGKGNEDWNFSAPHGAGRLMSRAKAKENLSLEEFKNAMKDVWTTSVNEDTLDEAPMAYKSIDDIIKYIGPTIEIIDVIRPIYNYKAY